MRSLTPRTNRRRRQLRRIETGLTAFLAVRAAAMAAVALAAAWPTPHATAAAPLQAPAAFDAAPVLSPAPPHAADPIAAAAGRPNYRYSVVPGGVYSAGELMRAMADDPVVADEYAHVSVAGVRAERNDAPRLAYMSYRIGDEIYWTREKVELSPGETILTDGETELRARCGNWISDRPGRTSDAEPDVEEFARVVIEEPRVFPAAAPAAPFAGSPPPPAALADASAAQPGGLRRLLRGLVIGAPSFALLGSGGSSPCVPR